MRRVLLFLALALSGAPAAAQEGCDFTQAELDEIVARAWPLVCAQVEVQAEAPTARLSRSREVRNALREEFLPQMRRQLADEAQAAATSRNMAAQLAPFLFGKYVWGRREVLVVPRTFERLARNLEMPSLCSREVLRAVLVHELVHAADDARFDIVATIARIESSEGLQAIDAVLEGHAQHVARRVCAELGWSAGFEALTASIGATPPSGQGEGVDLMERIRAAEAGRSYVQGERFVDAVVAERGAGGAAGLFRSPPPDLVAVFHPEWYLDPSTRPPSRLEFERALDRIERDFGGPGWQPVRYTLDTAQLTAAVSGLGDASFEEAQRLLGTLLANRGINLTSPGGERQTTALIYEFADADGACGFAALIEELTRLKDETMREGAIRVLESTYEELDEPGLLGFRVDKTMEVEGNTSRVGLISGCRDNVAFEIVFVGDPVEPVTQVELAGGMLDLALAPPAETLLAADFEDLEPGAVPAGWEAVQTQPGAAPARWGAVALAGAPSGERTLHVRATATGSTFNVLLAPRAYPADLDLAVELRADSGEEDQGGGLVWRARGPDDYYVTRWNPLEDNLRVYRVARGARTLLQSAQVEPDPEAWLRLEVRARGPRIEVALDGVTLLACEDATFAEAGRVGLWNKADASTWFDDLEVSAAP